GGIPGSLAALTTVTVPLRYWWPWFYEKSYVWTVGGPPPTPEAMSAQVAMRMAAPPSIVGYAWQWLAAINWTSLGWLERIAHPTLVISGDDDRLVPFANSLNLAIRIPNVRLFLARGEGHMLLFDPGSAALAVLTDYFGAATLAQAPVWRRLVKPESGDYRAAVRQRFGPGWAGAACAQANLGLQRVLSIGLPRPLGGSFRRR
ncbi:MAG: alpha/beta hydrolase, partial [Salinisphaera sp.]|nr:alpha/beta hydrolase [Salinisphaera sp.]